MAVVRENILPDLADMALRDPVGLFRLLGPDPRYLDAAFMREAGDRLEAAARRLQAGEIDLAAFDAALSDVVREIRFSAGTIEALRQDAPLVGPRRRTATMPRAALPTSASEIRMALQCDRQYCSCHRAHGTMAHCPAHSDETPSFHVSERGGRVLVHCHAGCSQETVIAALRARGLWGHRP